ncbi:MAG TPA: response regulator, partial [Caulifigura sp.]|nr:response regulator [Caulifigura sp.]
AFEIAAASQVAATREAAESSSSAAGESSSTDQLPPLRILVAEDNPFNGQLMTSLLGKRGHAVVIAENGEAALTAAMSQAFDVMLLDIHMPVLDGFEVIDGLRQWEASQPGCRRLPVIALTARSSREIRDRCLEAGMNDVLQKPTPADDLFRAIDAVMSGSPPSPGETESLIDRQMMLAVCGANENVMEGLKAAVLENLPKQLGDLERLDASGSLVELREAAHKIAGTLRAFSKPCGELALAIEESAIAGDSAACHRGVDQLAQEVRRLLKEIEGLTFSDLMKVAKPIVA